MLRIHSILGIAKEPLPIWDRQKKKKHTLRWVLHWNEDVCMASERNYLGHCWYSRSCNEYHKGREFSCSQHLYCLKNHKHTIWFPVKCWKVMSNDLTLGNKINTTFKLRKKTISRRLLRKPLQLYISQFGNG